MEQTCEHKVHFLGLQSTASRNKCGNCQSSEQQQRARIRKVFSLLCVNMTVHFKDVGSEITP